MTYKPNFNDPRCLRRIHRALGFVNTAFSDIEPRAWSSRYIDRYLGQQNNDLGKYLRNTLLIAVDHYYNMETGVCKKYLQNKEGIKSIYESLGIKRSVNIDTFEQELSSGDFEYYTKSDRDWHPLQHMPSSLRKSLMAKYGYQYEYDIQCCAPTLLYQYARRFCGLDKRLEHIEAYLADRTTYRQIIADKLLIETKVVKQIITAVFAGAPLSHYYASQCLQLLEGRHQHLDVLKLVLKDLVADIRVLWHHIGQYETRSYITTKTGQMRLKPLRGRDKWSVYFRLEREVMSSVRTYMKKKSIRYFNEHDGWRSDVVIDIEELRSYVRSSTGYVILIDWTICSF